ncbi:hypothetical protein FGO68_gene1448 [Halteria grandinella]|uniref:Uncharacterized protein n=1 Tax=Halteria grandinella TaxID=5974 RepID=A0A8J8NBB2_HALGN|nr:hypothetical protein FGO68_gene1448 [Halteria grandinella]
MKQKIKNMLKNQLKLGYQLIQNQMQWTASHISTFFRNINNLLFDLQQILQKLYGICAFYKQNNIMLQEDEQILEFSIYISNNEVRFQRGGQKGLFGCIWKSRLRQSPSQME